jgi:hypothetical protein
MAILNFLIAPIAQSGSLPQFIYFQTNDDYSVVTSPGYLNHFVAQGNLINVNQMALVEVSSTPNLDLFVVTYSGGNWTLLPNNPTPSGGGFIWESVTTNTSVIAGHAYVNTNNSSQISYTLPALAAFGDSFIVAGFGAGNWQIAPTGSQSVILGGSTVSAGHSMTSTSGTGVAAVIVCVVPNTTFLVYSMSGDVNIV